MAAVTSLGYEGRNDEQLWRLDDHEHGDGASGVRGRWTGFNSLFQNLIRVPAMLLGGYLYENVNPVLVFIVPIIVDALVRMPIPATVPETLKEQGQQP